MSNTRLVSEKRLCRLTQGKDVSGGEAPPESPPGMAGLSFPLPSTGITYPVVQAEPQQRLLGGRKCISVIGRGNNEARGQQYDFL